MTIINKLLFPRSKVLARHLLFHPSMALRPAANSLIVGSVEENVTEKYNLQARREHLFFLHSKAPSAHAKKYLYSKLCAVDFQLKQIEEASVKSLSSALLYEQSSEVVGNALFLSKASPHAKLLFEAIKAHPFDSWSFVTFGDVLAYAVQSENLTEEDLGYLSNAIEFFANNYKEPVEYLKLSGNSVDSYELSDGEETFDRWCLSPNFTSLCWIRCELLGVLNRLATEREEVKGPSFHLAQKRVFRLADLLKAKHTEHAKLSQTVDKLLAGNEKQIQ